ncbi:hypothetical protein P153DRAFT_328083 [Dothidotthia symphoricarpi CBS 119687]|uniref:Uncharacterized protein n=1 Tax=Dothidotthia symphoricarpi CBS 119687 TaxID=1392245 RepID=A0A6A5ZV38_9PLEO|nr:uncharacterized protein P153DRAFT_328083 [Dothidotthia symphoricarpi CBS 119687]KAF2123510.1 hypothetical protein P153DRAFT_328083 [Dothidotthia symphoricarpi CBS 119687]
MTSNWARSQGQGWLRSLFGQDITEPLKEHPLQIFHILEDLMSHKASSKDSATKTASLVASHPDAYWDLIGIYLGAAVRIADEDALRALVDYIVELASLPNAFNESQEAVVVDHVGYAGASVRIEPGELLAMGDGGKKLWRDLPNFSMEITERLQGPELYLHDIRSPANYETAKTLWRNFNTYLALLATSASAQEIPVLANKVRLACTTFKMALENSPETRVGKNVHLHVPAAAEWFRIAGDEIEKLCKDGTETKHPGDLWVSQGGGEVCDSARLSFWKKRMLELGYK